MMLVVLIILRFVFKPVTCAEEPFMITTEAYLIIVCWAVLPYVGRYCVTITQFGFESSSGWDMVLDVGQTSRGRA